MSESKQTAVEFLVESLLYLDNEYHMGFIDKNEYQARRQVFIEQAKQMEKEQIVVAFDKGLITENVYYGYDDKKAEQYYNETFKSE